MQLRYGMRLGRGLWVSGGFGVFMIYAIFWMLSIALGAAIFLGLLAVSAIGIGIQHVIKEKRRRTLHEKDVALACDVTKRGVKHVQFTGKGQTNPPALWGVYMVEPSHGSPYFQCGKYPAAIKQAWLENRYGTVRELMIFPDKPMAETFMGLLKRGVCRVKRASPGIISGFDKNDSPIFIG